MRARAGWVLLAIGTAAVACSPFSSTSSSPFGDAGAGDAGTSSAASPCATSHTLCADFDQGDLLASLDQLGTDFGGSGELDSAVSTSAPRSAHLVVPAGAAQCARAELESTLAGSYSNVAFAFDVRIGEASTDYDGFGVAYLQLGQCALTVTLGADTHDVFAELDPSGNTGVDVPLTKGTRPGRWSHVDVRLDAPNRTFSVRLDKASVLDAGAWPPSCPARGVVGIAVGAHCVKANQSVAAVHVDNVVVDAQ